MVTTRRNRNTASVEPAQLAVEAAVQQKQVSIETQTPKKRGRKPKVVMAQVETRVESQMQVVAKSCTTPRAAPASTVPTFTKASKRVTRAERAAGTGSPFRSYEQPKRQAEKKRKRTNGYTAGAISDTEPISSLQSRDDNNDESGMFFTDSKIPSSFPSSTLIAPSSNSEPLVCDEISQLKARILALENCIGHRDVSIDELEKRISALEEANAGLVTHTADLVNQNIALSAQLKSQQMQHVSEYASKQSSQFSTHFQFQISQALANHRNIEFDQDIMQIDQAPAVKPVFANGNQSAFDLLHKIEKAAKESAYVSSSPRGDQENIRDDVTMKQTSHASISKTTNEESSTPSRSIASPSGFFSRSFSALRAKLGFAASTPKAPSTPQIPATAPAQQSKPLPPPDTFTETLSLPPTPVGERVTTSKKKRTNPLMRVFMKGVEIEDRAKAEEWAKTVLPKLKSDSTFREKRKILETPMLVSDLQHFPSAKPWETGFGDPLGELDDDDVVPVWAVYLDLLAEEEEHKSKRRKNIHANIFDDVDYPSLDEQVAASHSVHSTPKLYDSHGQSASLLDFHPRRSVEPSPMFEMPLSHHEGGNVFQELQSHDSAAQIRTNEREALKTPSKKPAQVHNPSQGSFSVPDDSDDEDSSMISETAEEKDTPLWTQPPPPAPAPAHASLPAGASADTPAVPAVQQPVDEVERQRQKLMKHTPAKPSRLREATYPSPSLLSDAGNDSILAATPGFMDTSMVSIFADMPTAEPIDLDSDEQADYECIINSDQFKQQLEANAWPAPIITYDSDEEGISPN